MNDYALYIILRVTIFLMRFLPLWGWLYVAKTCGWIYYYLDGKKKRRAYAHLRLAFPNRSRNELKRIIRKMYMRLAQNCFEALYLPYLNEDYYLKHIRVPQLSFMKEALKREQGTIILACHAGSWELSSTSCPIFFKEKPYAMMVQTQVRHKRLDAFLNKLREKKNCHIIRVDELKKMVVHLSNGNLLAVVADHGGREGIPVEFFGKLAMTPVGAVKLAKKLNANIFLAFMHRLGGPYHEMLFKPYALERVGDEGQDLKINLTKINKQFEEWITQYPEEYLWFYKRWKYSPQKDVLVLSDAKMGHVKQSLALAQLIESSGVVLKTNVVEVVYKTKGRQVLLSIAALLAGSRLARFLFSFCLTTKSYQDVLRGSCDIVISTGASLAAVNLALAFENTARSMAVMRPGILPFKRFDLVIIPEHDQPPRRENILRTVGSLNAVSPFSMKKDFNLLCSLRSGLKELEDSSKLKIGLLVGGDSKNYKFREESIQLLCQKLKKILQEKDAILLLTTSRRTPLSIVTILKKNFGDDSRCKLLVHAATDNPSGTVGGIFYLSDILIISVESISMVSEAVASGKQAVVFEPTPQTHKKKVKRFLNFLSEKKYIALTKLEDIDKTVEGIIQNKPLRPAWDGRKNILEGLKRVL